MGFEPAIEYIDWLIGYVDRQTGCKVMAISAYPRWPSAAILDFIEPEIAPFDLPTPKTLS